MESINRQTFSLTPLHMDRFGRAKPSVLLHFAQEAAEGHCMILAADWQTLQEKGLFWAVIRQKLQITRYPGVGETLTVETWPMPTTRVAYPRSTVAYDEAGNEVFRAISLWVLMDCATRAMILPGKSGIAIDGTLRGTELTAPGSLTVRQTANQTQRTVRYSHLDRNGHMNNTRYLDWLEDLLPAAFHEIHPLRDVTVCYLSEALENEHLQLGWTLSEEAVLTVDALRTETDVSPKHHHVFSAQAVF